ncbi:SPOR domain-containing protein [Paenibacillus hodogayensis]|uniref:SPOR domain-containing protein n=1 Tax=Paenibacillus hodogayensis TaxID=279208 RepID=A0ABV5VVU7_9BACL
MNKARITYRFDEPGRDTVRREPRPVIPLSKEEFTVVEDTRLPGPEDVYRAEPSVRPEPRAEKRRDEIFDTGPLNQFTTDFGAWKSPFEAETERVERMIREAEHTEHREERRPEPVREPYRERKQERERERNRDRYPVEREGPIVDQEYDPGQLPGGYDRYDRYDRNNRPVTTIRTGHERNPVTPWLKIVASVTGAVATGVLIGFFVLSMFGGEDQLPGVPEATGKQQVAGTNPQTKQPDSAAASSGAKEPAAPAASAAAASVSAKIAEQSYTLLQNGVFSNQQGADAAVAELKKKGLAAFVQPSDKFYVYVGMSPSRDDALALSQTLKEQQMELFLKPITLPAADKVRWSGEQTGAPEQFFAQNRKLLQTIANFTTARLKEKTPAAIDDSTLQSIHTSHQAWTGASGSFGAGLAQEQKAMLQKWGTAMSTAVTSMDEYKKNPSPAFLWAAQSALMQALFAENELLGAIRVQ